MELERIIYIAIVLFTVLGIMVYIRKNDKVTKSLKPFYISMSAIAAIPIAVLVLG
ncbi:hypothetical protein VCHA31O73_360032 [Vibrio chagasii]|nr:hypothetical protein VCHA31O73_360032 [Vibrio chagasii]